MVIHALQQPQLRLQVLLAAAMHADLPLMLMPKPMQELMIRCCAYSGGRRTAAEAVGYLVCTGRFCRLRRRLRRSRLLRRPRGLMRAQKSCSCRHLLRRQSCSSLSFSSCAPNLPPA